VRQHDAVEVVWNPTRAMCFFLEMAGLKFQGPATNTLREHGFDRALLLCGHGLTGYVSNTHFLSERSLRPI
jgi:hypothetical protein